MEDPITGADALFQGEFNRGFNLVSTIIPVEHEDGNEILYPLGFALGTAKMFQQQMQRIRPGLSLLSDGPGTVESHGPLRNELKIMIRIKTPFIVAIQPLMRRKLFATGKNLHPIHMEQHLYPKTHVTSWHGITVLVYRDRGILVDPAFMRLHIGENSFRLGEKLSLLVFVKFVHLPLATAIL